MFLLRSRSLLLDSRLFQRCAIPCVENTKIAIHQRRYVDTTVSRFWFAGRKNIREIEFLEFSARTAPVPVPFGPSPRTAARRSQCKANRRYLVVRRISISSSEVRFAEFAVGECKRKFRSYGFGVLSDRRNLGNRSPPGFLSNDRVIRTFFRRDRERCTGEKIVEFLE